MRDDDFGCFLPGLLFVLLCILFVRTGFQPPTPGAWNRYKTAFVVATVILTWLAYKAREWRIAIGGTAVLSAVYWLHQH